MTKRALRACAALAATGAAQGCVVYSVASTAVSATATVVETTVDVGAAAVGGAVDLVDGDDEAETEGD